MKGLFFVKKEASSIEKNCEDVAQRLWFGETSTEPLEQLIVTMTEVGVRVTEVGVRVTSGCRRHRSRCPCH